MCVVTARPTANVAKYALSGHDFPSHQPHKIIQQHGTFQMNQLFLALYIRELRVAEVKEDSNKNLTVT